MGEVVAQRLQEPRGRSAVDNLVVDSQRQRQMLVKFDGFTDLHGLQANVANAENGDLRRVENPHQSRRGWRP